MNVVYLAQKIVEWLDGCTVTEANAATAIALQLIIVRDKQRLDKELKDMVERAEAAGRSLNAPSA